MQPQTDPTVDTRTLFPQTPYHAVVAMVIKATAGEDGALSLSTTTFPPSNWTWDHNTTSELFRLMGVQLLPGTYHFTHTIVGGFQIVELPEKSSEADARAITRGIVTWMTENFVALCVGLMSFPDEQSIRAFALEVVHTILNKAIEADLLSNGVPNPGAIEVRPTEIFGQGENVSTKKVLSVLLDADSLQGVRTLGGITSRLDTSGDQPVLFVSVVPQSNAFATFLNEELARRVRTALVEATTEVVTNTLVDIEFQRRLAKEMEDSLYATFQVDRAEVSAQADALLVAHCERLASKAVAR